MNSKRVAVGGKVFFVSFLLTNQETETGSRRSVSPFAHRPAVFEMASRSSLSKRKIHCDT